MQVCVRCFESAYISNFVSRFWLSPIAGWVRFAGAQEVVRSSISLSSKFGATTGAAAPHEFGYFWRTWLDLQKSDCLGAGEISNAYWSVIRSECTAIAGWFGAPLVMKNLNAVSYQIAAIAAVMPQARFLHVVRDRERTIQSILNARRTIGKGEGRWWSVRPPAWESWQTLPAREQVELQVDHIRGAVSHALAALPSERSVALELDEFLGDPGAGLSRLEPLLDAQAAPDAGFFGDLSNPR